MFVSAQGIRLTIWMSVFTVVITLFMAARLWAIRISKREFRTDDHLITVAYIATLAFHGITWWAVANGLGAHTAELDDDELVVQFKILLATGFTWLTATVFCKLSILYLYTCIFMTSAFRKMSFVMMGVVSAYGVSFIVVFCTNCQPISHSWNPVDGGHCKDVSIEEIVSVSVNMVIDSMIVVMPMPLLWGLQMPIRKKIAITFLFSLGLMVIAIMAWRIQITVQLVTQADFVFGLGNIGLAALLEVWLGIIAACIPVLTPLIVKVLGPAWAKVSNTSGGAHTGGQSDQNRHKVKHGTFGSSKKNKFGRHERDSYLELGEGRNLNLSEAMKSSSVADEEEDWSTDGRGINVKKVVQVRSDPDSEGVPGAAV